jgi:H+-translocating NAD(P) transhydrogenase subunit alpha
MGFLSPLGVLADTVAAQETAVADGLGLPTLYLIIVIFILSVFLGIEIIGKVPTTLHTPLMSGTNAIHGIVLVGAMIVLGASGDNLLLQVLGFIAVIFAAGNVVGGFVVTDRMLQMFKRKPQPGGKE